MRFRRIAPIVALAAAASLATLPSAAPAHAATVTGLPITSVYQVVAASAEGHIFISQGPDAPIVVTNLSGSLVASIANGARGVALSANGETLYAAIGDTITSFSTTTLKRTGGFSYQLPGPGFSLALQGNSLWVSYQSSPEGNVGDIDLATHTATWNVLPGGWVGIPPALAIDPSGSGVLVTASVGEEPPFVTTYNVSVPSKVTQIATKTEMSCGDSNSLSVLPGGKMFLCGGLLFSTTTLAADTSASYDGGFITAVAPDGAVALSGFEDVQTYPPGITEVPTADYQGFYGLSLPPGYQPDLSYPVGFAWSADSQRLFTVIESTSEGSPKLVFTVLSLYPFEKVAAPLTLTSTATTVQYGAPATITAHLGVTYSNRRFSLYKTPAGQPRTLLWSGSNDPSGIITTSGAFTRNATFTAVFTGDPLYAPATVTLKIKVGAKITSSVSGYYKISTVAGLQYHVYHHTATLRNLVTVVPSKAGECARLEIQQGSNSVWGRSTFTNCMDLNKYSQTILTRKLGPTGWFRVRADFDASAKDTTNVSTDGSWVYYVVTK